MVVAVFVADDVVVEVVELVVCVVLPDVTLCGADRPRE